MKVPSPSRAGFSLPELLTTITILAILAGIAIASYTGLHTAARESAAKDAAALLNRGLLHFNQANWDIVLSANDGSATDELAVLRALQWRDPDPRKATPGSAYIPAQFNDTTSSSESDFRIRWNGRAFELLAPGTPGTGLKTGSLQAETTPSVYAFPPDYTPPAAGQHE